jgi:putative ABC transport system permease protein
MFVNNFKIAIRNILRNKTFSLINITGLTIGLISFFAISLYIIDEFSYDRFQKNSDRIYRAIINAEFDGQIKRWGSVPNKLGPTAAREIPEIEKMTRVFPHNFGDIAFISTETEKFSETNLFYADTGFFDVFTISMLKGTPGKVLDRPGTIILSETSARRYFGDADPIGKSLLVDNAKRYEVTGVYKDFPGNSFLKCQLIASFSSIRFGTVENQNWGNASFDTYFLLNKGVSLETINKKIAELLDRDIPKNEQWFSITLQPLLDIRLHSNDLTASIDRREYGDYNQVKILIALALVILLIASVNYMNLATARSQRRNKEVGIAKTFGASFLELNAKFYFETSIFVLLSLLISLFVFIVSLPLINSITGKELSRDFIYHSWFWLSWLALWLMLTLLSGFYPAFYLSSFSPKTTLLKTYTTGSQVTIRKVLVVFQFSISIILIICALTFYKQMNFIRDKKLGYEPDQVIAIMVSAAKDRDQVISLKTELESLSEVRRVARSQSYPGIGTSGYTITPDGATKGAAILATRATYEILDVLGIKLLAGKSLPETKDPNDTTVQVIINKSTADYLQLSPEEAVGRRVKIFYNHPAEVVGVSEDFHFTSLHQAIGPYCFDNSTDNGYIYLLVKLQTKNLASTINKIETIFSKIIPASFEYTFLDQQMARLYKSDERLSKIVLFFSGLAIFIACLGLYSLASFTADQRTKGIGIRKVFGATVTQMVAMLSKEFVVLILIAFVVGIPAGYFLMNNWLETFAYRTNLDLFIIFIAGAVVLVIAWLTVSYESFKAARRNPVESLKGE